MTKKLGFLVDMDRCIGCNSCEMACKNENQLDSKVNWRKVYPVKEDRFGQPGRVSVSLACNHCEQPACLKACPVVAYQKREDGIVLHDEQRCIGCKMCILACPYGVPQFNDRKQRVEKCHMCYQRQDQGKKPACVSGCPMEAIRLIDANDLRESGISPTIPGFPDVSVTQPTTRFISPRTGQQIRRDR